MNTEYSWEKRFFSSKWKIYRNYRPVGVIKSPFFSRKGTAEIDGEKYEFRDSKWINLGDTEIFDASGNTIGRMKCVAANDENLDNNKVAEIQIGNNVSFFDTGGIKDLKTFTIHNAAGLQITYKSTSWHDMRGEIKTNKDNKIELLLGVYILAIYSRLTAAILAGILALIGVFLIPGAAIFLWQLVRKLILGF